jgi:hypothetical protein
VNAETADDRCASDIGTSTGSSTLTGLVRDPRPPCSPMAIHRPTTARTAMTRSTGAHSETRHAPPTRLDRLPPSTSAIAITTNLRVHLGDRQFWTLNHGLRVRMLTGWEHLLHHFGSMSGSRQNSSRLPSCKNAVSSLALRSLIRGAGPRTHPSPSATLCHPPGLPMFLIGPIRAGVKHDHATRAVNADGSSQQRRQHQSWRSWNGLAATRSR